MAEGYKSPRVRADIFVNPLFIPQLPYPYIPVPYPPLENSMPKVSASDVVCA